MSFWTLDIVGEMERMRRELDRLLDDARPSGWTFPFSRVSFLPGRSARAYPLLNIAEGDEYFYVHALAPGVDPKSLEISVIGDQLNISGEKKSLPVEIEPKAVHRNERAAGKFVRSIALSSALNVDKIRAQYNDGILRISIPKAEAAKPRKIDIKVG